MSICWDNLDPHALPNLAFYTQGASGSPRDLGKQISRAMRSRSQNSGGATNEDKWFEMPFDLVNLNAVNNTAFIKASENAADDAGGN